MNEKTQKMFKESAEQAIEQTNKESLYKWLKSIALGLWGIITIITCASVWNSEDTASFIKVMTAVLFMINAAVIAIIAVKYKPYKK